MQHESSAAGGAGRSSKKFVNRRNRGRGGGRFLLVRDRCRPVLLFGNRNEEARNKMIAAIVLLLLIVALFAVGFAAVKFLWILALVLLAVWLIGFVFRSGERAAWYRW
jgi:hypothetical protein